MWCVMAGWLYLDIRGVIYEKGMGERCVYWHLGASAWGFLGSSLA